MDVEFRPLRSEDWEDAVSMWEEVFGVGGWIFRSLHEATEGREWEDCLVAVADGKLVSAVDIFRRYQRDEHGDPVLVGGIGSVVTREPYRGRGLSGELLMRAIRRMEEIGCVWSFLGTGVNAHYERYGWRTIPLPLRHAKHLPPSGEIRGSVSPYRADRLLELAPLYERTNRARPVTLVRSPRYWTIANRARIENEPTRRLYIADGLQGHAEAYIVGSVEDDWFSVEELGGDPARFTDLLACLRQAAPNAVRAESHIATDPDFDPALEAALGPTVPQDRTYLMARPISSRWTDARLAALFRDPRAAHYGLDAF